MHRSSTCVSPIAAMILIMVAACLGSCSKPPTEEMLRAEKSLDAARDSEASRYAGEEIDAARARFEMARELVAARKYDEARAAAAEAEQLAHQAVTLAEMRKEKLKTEAAQIIEDLRKKVGELRLQTEELTGSKAAEVREKNREQFATWDAAIGAAEADGAAGNLQGMIERLAALRKEIEKNSAVVIPKENKTRRKGGS